MLNRDLLLQEVWQVDRINGKIAVVYVRQKLEANGERRLLHTVRGRDYCLGQGLREA